jgi:hypothetical protein
MRIDLTCSVCGKAFSVKPYRAQSARACSNVCAGVYRRASCPTPLISDDGLTARIPIYAADGSVRAYVTVDASDAAWLGQWRWGLRNGYASRAERVNGTVYRLSMHREILGLKMGDPFDGEHKNRIRTDCRRENLRIVPKGANAQNVPGHRKSTSSYRGVSWIASQSRWRVQMQVNRKMHYIGSFRDEDEAGRVARAARARLLPYATD